uniref:Serine-threonine/tyrosine-protein kinase catalytic domain-containing protein n=1 Tax=Arundo donax TaxID=35708 RepID=A0A0A9DAR2_ARUDO
MRLKLKYSPQSLVQYMEIVSKLRHHHLVSIIGHCIVNDLENPNIASSVYLISECVSNGSLRSHLTGNYSEQDHTCNYITECLQDPQLTV